MLKKLLQIASVALLLAVPLSSRADNDTLVVADGTATNSNVPIYGYWADAPQHQQMIYPASMLTDMVGQNIVGMWFDITGSWSTPSATINMAIVADSTLSGYLNPTDMTMVWEGEWTSSVQFQFGNAFVYTGGNLLVDIVTTAGGYSSSTAMGISRTGASVYAYSSNSPTVQSFLPKATFVYNDEAFCASPSGLTTTAVGANEISLTWNAGGTETQWALMVGDSVIENISTNAYTVSDLNPSTYYMFRVRAVCGAEDSSAWTAARTFHTMCVGVSQLPWTNNFESENADEVPLCWSVPQRMAYIDYYGDTIDGISVTESNYDIHSGFKAIYAYMNTYYGAVSNQGIIATPRFVHNPADLHVTFWAYGYTFNGSSTLEAGIMTDPSDSSTFIPLLTLTPSDMRTGYSGDYDQFEFYTSGLTTLDETDSVAVAFRITNGSSDMSLFIDDIMVDAMGDCLPPLLNSGVVDSIGYESVRLTWQVPNESSNFDVMLGHWDEYNHAVWQHFEAEDTTLYIESGLIPGTYYEAYAATVCGDDTTNYVFLGSFTTQIRCYPVAGAAVAALTTNAAALAWTYVDGGIEAGSVDIELMDMTDSVLVDQVNALGTNYTFTGLTANHLYRATLNTICGDSDTSASVVLTFSPHAAPCAEVAGTGSNMYVPFYTNYNNGFSEMLYDASILAGMDTVTGLAFEVAATLDRDNVIDIWMGYTNETSFNGSNLVSIDSMVHVVSDYTFSTANTGWLDMIPFDTVFVKDANDTGNLVIAVYNHTGSYIYGLSWATHNSAVGSSYYFYTDNSLDPHSPSGSSNSTPNAANIQLYGNCGGSGDCGAPSAQIVSTDTTAIELSWLPGGDESEWTVQYRVATDVNWITAGNSLTTNYFVTNLNPGTQYAFRVGALCGDSVVYSTATMGYTLCGVPAAPISIAPNGENQCWTYIGSGYYSSYSNYYYIYNGGMIISPRMADSINNLQVRVNCYGAPFQVGVCDVNGDSVTWIQTVTPDYDYGTFTSKKVYLNHYTGNQHHIVLKADAGYNYTYMNNITIELLDDCMPVDSLQLDSVTTTDAWLSWVSDGNNFEIKYLRESDTTGIWQTATSTTTSVHLTGLNSNDRYQIKVFNVCSATSKSDSVTLRIASGCTAYPVPFSEQFGHEELPVCWSTVSSGNTYYTFDETSRYSYNNYVYTQANSTGFSTDWLMTPPIQIPANADFIKLVYLVGGGAYPYEGYPDSYGSYDVFVSTTGYGDTTTYTTLLLNDTVHSRTTNGVTVDYARIPLSAYAGQTVSFGFRARCNQYGSVYFSDIQVREAADPMYYVYGSTEAFAGDTTTFRAEYQEGDTTGMTLAWYSRMVANGEATVVPSANNEYHIIYTAAGIDSMSFTATNTHGADTVIWNVNVFVCDGINEFPYHQGFEDNDACWQKVYADNDPSINPMILVDENNLGYNLDSVYEGTYCFRFSSFSRTSVYDQYLISPLLHGTNRTLNFHYAMYGSSDYLWVGYSTTDRDTASFTWTPVTNSTSWAEYTDSIADNVKYIAFRYYGDYTYYVYLDALNITGTASQLTCDAPVNVVASADETTATVNFISEVGNYEVAIAEQWDEATVTPVAITDTFYTFTGLTAATEYTIGVRSICNASLASDWVTVTVTTDEHPCATPSALTVSDVTLTSATLGWTIGEAETQWELHVTGTNYDESFTVTTNPYTVTGLTPAVTYSFTVSAICSETQTSDPSEAQTFTTESCQPVSGVNVSDITTTTATVTWTAPAGVTAFEVEYGASGFNQGAGTTVQASTNSASLTGLTSNMAYDVYVRSVCAEGIYSAWSSVTTFTTDEQGEGIDDVNSAAIALYPNPATTTVTITGIEGQATVTIVDMNGRVSGEWRVENDEITLDLTGYAQGAYFVRITGEQQNAIRKLIVK